MGRDQLILADNVSEENLCIYFSKLFFTWLFPKQFIEFNIHIFFKPYSRASGLEADAEHCRYCGFELVRHVTGTGSGLLGGNPQSGCSDVCSYSKRATVGVRAPM